VREVTSRAPPKRLPPSARFRADAAHRPLITIPSCHQRYRPRGRRRDGRRGRCEPTCGLALAHGRAIPVEPRQRGQAFDRRAGDVAWGDVPCASFERVVRASGALYDAWVQSIHRCATRCRPALGRRRLRVEAETRSWSVYPTFPILQPGGSRAVSEPRNLWMGRTGTGRIVR